MSEENTSDILYEENFESDSERTYTYFPFIKIENDGTVLIDGQRSSQNVSQMNGEARVLMLTGVSEQFNGTLDLIGTEHKFRSSIDEETISETATASDEADISETLMHDHNYEETNRTSDIIKCDTANYTYLIASDQLRNNCTMCHKSFNTPGSLKRHIRVHTGERPFQCQVCEKFFSQQSNLWKHVRTHTGERPFECPHCKKRFSQRANMKKHIIIHTGERPYVCLLCSRGFTQQANLSKHMRLHTGEKPYCCSYCDKRFTQRSNLQKHEHLHEGIKPYTCEICCQAFTQQSNLRKHEMMHNNIKKFVCDVCNKGYVQKVSLMKHKQRCPGAGDYKFVATELSPDETKAIRNQINHLQLLKQYSSLSTIGAPCLDQHPAAGIIINAKKEFLFQA